jgi:TIR domain
MNDRPEAMFEAALTLEALKKLPMEQKMRLLLARLKEIGRSNESALSKHNLTMAADFNQLAYGYPDNENLAVREYLMLTPWAKLVAEGYLGDPRGSGFFRVTEDGDEFLKGTPAPTSKPLPHAILPDSDPTLPVAFISYSWDGEDHQNWVLKLAERLQGEDGVQIILDKWNLKPGQDRLHFMEQAITRADFVIVVCTDNYASKADGREGGVGYESSIITSQLAKELNTGKFVPVLRKGSFEDSLPIYLSGRFGINLSAEPYSEEEYETLMRLLHDELIQGPALGKEPDFIKKLPKPAGSSVIDAVAKIATDSGVVLRLGAPKDRPNAFAYGRYDKGGVWMTAVIRLWEIDGKISYSFETLQGDQLTGDEFIGTKDEVVTRLFNFHRGLKKEGYKLMNFMPGPDPDFNIFN